MKFYNPKPGDDLFQMHDWPVLIEMRKGDTKTYFFIEDHRTFHDSFPSFEETQEILPDYKTMKKLVDEHGKEINLEETERGVVFTCGDRQTGDVGYTEFRFRKDEE